MSASPSRPAARSGLKSTSHAQTPAQRAEAQRNEAFRRLLSSRNQAVDSQRQLDDDHNDSNLQLEELYQHERDREHTSMNSYENNLEYVLHLIRPLNTIEIQVPIVINLRDFEPFLREMYQYYIRFIIGSGALHYGRLTEANFIRVCKMMIKGRADLCAKRIALRSEPFMVRLTTSMTIPRPLAEVINGIGAFGHYQQTMLVYPVVNEGQVESNDRLANTSANVLRQFTAFCDAIHRQGITTLSPVSGIADGTAWWSINLLTDERQRATGYSDNVTCEIHTLGVTPVDRYISVIVQSGIMEYPELLSVPLFTSERIANARQLRPDFFNMKRPTY